MLSSAGIGSGFTLKMLDNLIFHLVTLYTTTKKDRENFAGDNRLQHSRLMTRRSGPLVADSDSDSSMEYDVQSGVKDLFRTVDAFVFVYDASLDSHSGAWIVTSFIALYFTQISRYMFIEVIFNDTTIAIIYMPQ